MEGRRETECMCINKQTEERRKKECMYVYKHTEGKRDKGVCVGE